MNRKAYRLGIVAMALIADLTPFIERSEQASFSDYPPAIWPRLTVDQGVYAVPVEAIPNWSLIYDKASFDEAGLAHPDPNEVMTWDDVWAMAPRLDRVAEDGRLLRVAIDPLSASGKNARRIAASWGIDILDERGKANLATGEWERALENAARPYWQYGTSSVRAISGWSDRLQNGFQAMQINGPWTPRELETRGFTGELGYTWIPQQQGLRAQDLSAWLVAMPTGVKDPELAWEFIYFLEGRGRIEVPTGVLSPQRYHLVVYPPGLPHAEWADPVDPEKTIWLRVAVSATWPEGVHLLVTDADGKFRWLVENLALEYAALGKTRLAGAYVRTFLCLVERAWKQGVWVEHDAVDVAVQFMHTHYTEEIDLDRLAALVHLSKSRFVHCFRDRLGISPIRYLQQTRIDAAKRLLATTGDSVSDVAKAVGFRDPLYFSRVMKRLTGRSPTDFRKWAANGGAAEAERPSRNG